MITGAHVVLFTTDEEADRRFFRDVLGFPLVDAGGGWLIFAPPDGEAAFHPAEDTRGRQLLLMCDDLDAEMAALQAKGVAMDAVEEAGWGRATSMRLPGGGAVGLYQPRHPTPPRAGV